MATRRMRSGRGILGITLMAVLAIAIIADQKRAGPDERQSVAADTAVSALGPVSIRIRGDSDTLLFLVSPLTDR